MTRNLIRYAALAVVVAAGLLLWQNRLAVADQIRLVGYTAPANVSTLAGAIGFTDLGQRYFYASHPVIEGKPTFSSDCGNAEASGTILGCYTNDTIYVYDVTDQRLDGVKEVTAAHETLHAAYARLSDSDRSKVDAMLEREYTSLSNNTAFKQRFSVYDSLNQADKLNELHSIFGTEITPLSNELETYYKRYFNDRSTVTDEYSRYQAPFNELTAEQANLKTRINELQSQIATSRTQYETDRAALNADIRTFNQRSNGGYSSQSEFEADRSALAGRADALKSQASDINAKIDQYNDAVKQYNALSVQTQDLQNSLDSGSVPAAPSV